jgi:N-methylhydantoinase A
MSRKIRIGIDVGGTFTDAIALDNETYEIIGIKKVPTTHNAKEGVTKGVIDALNALLEVISIPSEDVIFIAHGTTQATNALLEGDVANVGILGMGQGMGMLKAKKDTEFDDIVLGDGKSIKTQNIFINTNSGVNRDAVEKAIDEFNKQGVNVIVATEAFSVDDPANELEVCKICNEAGLLSTSSHEISKLYGLRSRTKTAIINASILPKMMQTADLTNQAVANANIKAPLMIMRSDGGVMQVDEVKKRPILTVLSGPAAGVAGALMYEKISDGIFIEVGGTSSDISAVKNGRVITKYAKIGGHSTYVNSLDINTIGIAGGSMIRFKNNTIVDVGPRSAHIADLDYAIFADPEELEGAKVISVRPLLKDPEDYLALQTKSGKRYAVTLTCAANFLGYVGPEDYSYGNPKSGKYIFDLLEKSFNRPARDIASDIIRMATDKLIPAINEFIKEYGLNKDYLVLTGGGGGCSTVVPALAQRLNMKHKIPQNAPVISTIGAALAMVRDTIERTIVNPTKEDIMKIRNEAENAAIRSGASPETIQVTIDIDTTKNIVKAVAVGATELSSNNEIGKTLDDNELIKSLEELLDNEKNVNIRHLYNTDLLSTFEVTKTKTVFLNIIKKQTKVVYVLDRQGIVKLIVEEGIPFCIKAGEATNKLNTLLPDYARYDETGQRVPDLYIIIGGKIIDLSGLDDIEQIISLSNLEIDTLDADTDIVVIIKQR